MGALGGGVWHLIKGSKNSPSGYRVRGAIEVRDVACQLRGTTEEATHTCAPAYVGVGGAPGKPYLPAPLPATAEAHIHASLPPLSGHQIA